MKASIEVKDRKEAALIQQALADPETRAYVNVMGALLGLPNERARRRVLTYVSDLIAEQSTTDKS